MRPWRRNAPLPLDPTAYDLLDQLDARLDDTLEDHLMEALGRRRVAFVKNRPQSEAGARVHRLTQQAAQLDQVLADAAAVRRSVESGQRRLEGVRDKLLLEGQRR